MFFYCLISRQLRVAKLIRGAENFLAVFPLQLSLICLQDEENDEMNEDEDESNDGDFKRENQFQVRLAKQPCVT